MFDLKQMFNQYLEGQPENKVQAGSGSLGGIAGGALAGGLVGLLAGTKTGRKIGRNALTYGGTAVLGGLAYKAWRDWQSGKPVAELGAQGPELNGALPRPPSDSAFVPKPGEEADFDRVLIRAMLAGAKADGQVDAREKQRITEQMEASGMDEEMRDFVLAEIQRPLDMDAIVSGATCMETAAEIYTASLLVADPSGPAEQGYLAMLAARLKLDPGLVEHIHANAARPLSVA